MQYECQKFLLHLPVRFLVLNALINSNNYFPLLILFAHRPHHQITRSNAIQKQPPLLVARQSLDRQSLVIVLVTQINALDGIVGSNHVLTLSDHLNPFAVDALFHVFVVPLKENLPYVMNLP